MDDPFSDYSDAERAELSDWVTDSLEPVLGTSETFHILRVLCGDKPGAYVSITIDPDTNTPIYANEHVDLDSDTPLSDTIEAFLDAYDLAYATDIRESEATLWRSEGNHEQISTHQHDYFIATDADQITEIEPTPSDVALGEFLGYPEEAINAFASDDDTGWKAYRTKVKALHAVEESPSAFDYINYYACLYRGAPTVDSQRTRYQRGKHHIELREAMDDSLDVDYQFSLGVYRDSMTMHQFHFHHIRLLWWLFYYQLKDRLLSPRDALGDTLLYLKARLGR